jgi:hypothetical protein
MNNCQNLHLDRTSMPSVRSLRLQGKRCLNWARVFARSGLNEVTVGQQKPSIKVPEVLTVSVIRAMNLFNPVTRKTTIF